MQQHRNWFLPVLMGALALFVWWPVDFSLTALGNIPERIAGIGWPIVPELREALANVLVFIPLGLAVRGSARTRLTRAALLGLALSVALEAGQLFLPNRIISILDIGLNVLGAVSGAILPLAIPGLLRRLRAARLAPGLVIVGSMAVTAGCFIAIQNYFASLATWSTGFTLNIGNEATGDRLWCGEWAGLLLATDDRFWTARSFDLTRLHEQDKRCPWYRSEAPPHQLIEAARRANRFYLQVRATPADTIQTGPARIVSISANPRERNITIGQAGSDLIVRVRRLGAGTNGNRPFYHIEDVFGAGRPVWLRVDVGSDVTRVTAGGKTIEDVHDVATQWWALFLNNVSSRRLRWDYPSALIFWLIFMAPAGALSAAAGRRQWEIGQVVVWVMGASLFAVGLVALSGARTGQGSAWLAPLAAVAITVLGYRILNRDS